MNNMAFKVGLLIVTVVAMIAISLGYVIWKKEIFAPVTHYNLISSSGEGLTEGMPVVFRGFEIGDVDQVELGSDGVVYVGLNIPSRHTKWIREGSRFVLDRPLVGKPRIVVESETLSTPPLNSEKPQQIIIRDGIAELIAKAQPILTRADHIVANIDKVTSAIVSQDRKLADIIDNIQALTEKFSRTKSLIELATGDARSAESVARSFAKSEKIMDGIESELLGRGGAMALTKELLGELIVELKKVGVILDNGAKMSADAAESTGNLKKLREEVDMAIKRASGLIEQIDRRLGPEGAKEWKVP